ncbi:hypothetical protein FIBSPDRAFT_1054185 [Athelia psychrophila]|uniref:Zn(2)-C6 fungal-type domain-containing protein n=1 Tax=Athelia psychrophila TaxID=1759441 RepID=A0A167VQU5_9AGAM|nr:hypothetical protein FIBSPDRAFT_1054185 [Fibularhizoctonia sp. CBS 109695]
MTMPSKPKPIPRGSACLSCRKRKMRCDGERPSCTQCAKAGRSEDCDYDDQHQKSRTQVLEERIVMLESKIRRLEAAASSSSSSSSYLAGQHPELAVPGMENTPMWTMGDTGDQQHEYFGSEFSPDFTFDSGDLNDLQSTSTTPSGLGFDYLEPFPRRDPQVTHVSVPTAVSNETYQSPVPTHQDLEAIWTTGVGHGLNGDNHLILEAFASHTHQCGFELDMNRFRHPGRMAPHPSPALTNAVNLVGYYFLSSPYFAEAEASMLTETIGAIATGIQHSDRLVDVVSASCLLAFYYYVNGQAVEGYQHCFAAVSLAITLGLHQLCTDPRKADIDTFPLKPHAQDAAELRDRISTFWQVYNLDRAWSVANQLPIALPDVRSLEIRTPWPKRAQPFHEISRLFSFYPESEEKPFMPALRVEAVSLYERAYRLSTTAYDKMTLASKRQELEETLDVFVSTLPSITGSEAWRSQSTGPNPDLVAIHAMTDAACIFLHKSFTGHYDSMAERCLTAAHNISSAARLLKEDDYEYLDPAISGCWKELGELYIYILFEDDRISGRAREMHLFSRELNHIIYALRKLGKVFPISRQHASILEQIRAERCSRPTGKLA